MVEIENRKIVSRNTKGTKNPSVGNMIVINLHSKLSFNNNEIFKKNYSDQCTN